MLNVGPLELLVILIVALVVVGPEKLPELARAIGRTMRELRKIQDDLRDTIRFDADETPEPAEHQVHPIYDEPSEPPVELSEGFPEEEPGLQSTGETDVGSALDEPTDADNSSFNSDDDADATGGTSTEPAQPDEPRSRTEEG